MIMMANKFLILLIPYFLFSQNFIYDSDDWYVIKKPGSIHSITEGPFNVYFGAENGIFVYDKFDENITFDYQINKGLDLLDGEKISYVYYDDYSSQIWIVTNHGIYFKNPIFNEYQNLNVHYEPYRITAFGSIDKYIILEYMPPAEPTEYIVINSFSGSVIDDVLIESSSDLTIEGDIGINLEAINWSSSYLNYDKDIDLSTYYSDNWLIGFRTITDQYGNEESAIVSYLDNDSNIWYGTNDGKLIKGSKYSNKVDVISIGPPWNSITSMSKGSSDNWYLSKSRFKRSGYKSEFNYYKKSDPFISIWNEYNNNWSYFNESDFSEINNPDINCHLNIDNQFLVLGTMNSLIIISINNPKNFQVISKVDGLNDYAIFDIKYNNNNLFVMTAKGISIYSMKYNTVIKNNILDDFGLSDSEILDFFILDKSLFFSTKSGLFKYSIIDEEIDKISDQFFRQIDFYNDKVIALNHSLWLIDYSNRSENRINLESARNFKIADNYVWLNLIDSVKLINIDSMEEWIYNHNDGFIDVEIFDIGYDNNWVYFLTSQGVIFYNWSNYHF